MPVRVCNIERCLPTVETAKSLIEQEIRDAKQKKIRCLKIIHGYGSGGSGGSIKRALPDFLDRKMRQGAIADYILGEDFSLFDPLTQRAMLRYPDLSGDQDLNKANKGVTILLLPIPAE